MRSEDQQRIGRIGHYRILRTLGVGGKGEIFLAEDDRLERRVALKILARDKITPESARVLHDEVRAISSLNHPRILTIYEVGCDEGVDYMATEYVDGENLRELLMRGPLGVRKAVDVAIALAEALTAAHEAGVIHGDIKPENVMIRRDGHVKVLDFGVARLARAKDHAARPFEGTLHYVAPELLLGAKSGERSDIFSFGVLLYELLSGEPPFDGQTMDETRSAILEKEPRRLRRLNRQVPTSLEAVVDRALTKDPAGRYQNASKLLMDLQSVRKELDAEDLRRNGFAVPGSSWRRARVVATAAAFVLVVLAAAAGSAWLVNRRHVARAPEALAVLPFENRAGDERGEVLADGLTESLISELSRLSHLRVTARSSVYRFAESTLDPRRIGRELGADVVLVGTLQRKGPDLLISAELVDVVEGERLWGDTYTRRAENIVALEQTIATSIAEALRATLVPSRAKRGNPEAHVLYLEGRYSWNKRTKKGFNQAIERFNAAIDRDPSYAAAYAGLADVYNLLGTYGDLAPADAFPRARSAALKAIELDPNLAEAHTSLAYALQNYDWDWKAADVEYRKALALSPSYAIAHHWYGGFLMLMGRFDEAIEHRNEAAHLDPLSPQIHAARGSPYLLSRRYAEAIDAYRQALALDPKLARVHLSIASAMLHSGDTKGALGEIERARSLSGDTPDARSDLAYAYARAGRPEEARALLRDLKRSARKQYVDPYEFARVEIALGEEDAALDDLERAFQMRSNLMMNLKVDPALDPIRDTPRFKDLLERMRFP